MKAKLVHHYSNTTYHRSQEQLKREQYLLPFVIPFNRWFLIPAAIVIQFCCGSLYAWSVYNSPIELEIYGHSTETAAITFYIAVGCFGTSAAIFGPWLERNGPRKASALGASGFYVANLLAALAVYAKQLWLLYVGYGVIGGFALGLSYISPVSPLQKFFPDYRGLTSGLAVCGFGAGSIAAAPLQNLLISKLGVPSTFLVLGSAYFVAMSACTFVLRTPPPDYKVISADSKEVLVPTASSNDEEGSIELTEDNAIPDLNSPLPNPEAAEYVLLDAIRSRDFAFMYGMFFANTLAGLVILSRLSNMVQALFGASKTTGAFVVSINGAFNLSGRFLFGAVSDHLGRKTCFLLTLIAQMAFLASMRTILESRNYEAFLACIWMLASCYGASFGLIPAFLADMFGSQNIGACHGIILTAWSIAGVGGGLTYTAIFNYLVPSSYPASHPYPYLVNFAWILAFICIGFVLTVFVRSNVRDRLMTPDKDVLLQFRFVGRLLRIRKTGMEYVSRDQEEREWEAYLASSRI